jgi:hypothetical protein
LIVLDRDPLKIPVQDIANVKVTETVVGGVTVYEARSRAIPKSLRGRRFRLSARAKNATM